MHDGIRTRVNRITTDCPKPLDDIHDAGLLGFEPRYTESESVVLPIERLANMHELGFEPRTKRLSSACTTVVLFVLVRIFASTWRSMICFAPYAVRVIWSVWMIELVWGFVCAEVWGFGVGMIESVMGSRLCGDLNLCGVTQSVGGFGFLRSGVNWRTLHGLEPATLIGHLFSGQTAFQFA